MPSAAGAAPERDAVATGSASDPWTRTTGSLMMMVVPPPGVAAASIVPWCAVMISREMNRPSPSPSPFGRAWP